MADTKQTVVLLRSTPSSAEFKRGLKLAEQLKESSRQVRLCLLSGAVLATGELQNKGWDLLCHKDSAEARAIDTGKIIDSSKAVDYDKIVDLLFSDKTKVIGAF